MAFLDMLNDLAKNLGDKTNDVIETGKLTGKVSSERSAAGEELKKIGEHYYNLWLSTGEIAPELQEICVNAKVHLDAAAEAQAEIDRIKAEKEAEKEAERAAKAQAEAQIQAVASGITCQNCGTINAEGTKFCQECGTKLEIPAPAGPVCPSCGTVNAEGTKFCQECGTKLEIPAPQSEPMRCPNCGTEVPEGTKFCANCGQKMIQPAAEPTAECEVIEEQPLDEEPIAPIIAE